MNYLRSPSRDIFEKNINNKKTKSIKERIKKKIIRIFKVKEPYLHSLIKKC